MKELVELIAKGLVEQPEAVSVREVQREQQTIYEVSVAPSDIGKVVGKGGRLVKAFRTVVSAASFADGKRVNIEIK
ncbi:KH domain-containing protein [Sulfoacidibacillus thermotolerans]|uniref:RNA-binding protein KhpA n=1 Tax=Sulfoacidibacillus thermotolerans TaxID=1765684 RepID=A0A2U3D7W4_SULT2|nr:KH domain-containing protein [Sulfoacidibacillus thermotolerans]PWI57359.1 hypothetical protein BM613_09195 [Sulfoacidibacillus thermotolerans]